MGRLPEPEDPSPAEPKQVLDIAYAKRWLKETRRKVNAATEPKAKLMAVVGAFKTWDPDRGILSDALRVLEGREELKAAKNTSMDRFEVEECLRLMRLAVRDQHRATASVWASAFRAIKNEKASKKDLKNQGIHGLAKANRSKAASEVLSPNKRRPGRPNRRRYGR